MDKTAMRQLLEEASAFLCTQCPTYHRDKTLVDAMYPMLCAQPDPVGRLFCAYSEMILDRHLKQCLATYERGFKLAKISSKGVFPFAAGEKITQNYFLVFARRLRQLPQARKALISAADDVQREILDFYFTVLADMLDFEHMYSRQLGCQNGTPDPKYLAWVQNHIRPDRRFDLSWWGGSF